MNKLRRRNDIVEYINGVAKNTYKPAAVKKIVESSANIAGSGNGISVEFFANDDDNDSLYSMDIYGNNNRKRKRNDKRGERVRKNP